MINHKPLFVAAALSLILGTFPSVRAEEEQAKEVPTYAVLKVDKGDDVEFKVVLSTETSKEKTRLLEESKVQRAEWKFQKAAFLKDKDNEGKEYSVPEPLPVKVSVVKNRIKNQDDAQRAADECKQKADKEREETRKKKPGAGGGGAGGNYNTGRVTYSGGGINGYSLPSGWGGGRWYGNGK